MRPSAHEFAEFNGLLATVVERGLPLAPAFGLLSGIVRSPALSESLRGVGRALEEGKSLPDALGGHPDAFPPAYCGLVRAGAEAGRLAEVLRTAQTESHLRARLRAKLHRLILYISSGFVIGELVLGTIVLMSRNMEGLYRQLQMSEETLEPTAALIQSGALLFVFLPVAFALGFAAYAFLQRSARTGWIGYLLPVWGTIQKSRDLALFCCAVGLRLRAGTPMVDALRGGRDSVGNRRFRKLADGLIRRVSEGEPLSSAFFYHRFFPKTLSWGISLAEENGEVPRAFDTFAGLYTTQMERGFEMLQELLTPLGIVVVGNVTLIGAILILMPFVTVMQGLSPW